MDATLLHLEKPRYAWVDVLKFLGIYSIYLGHMGNAAGQLYPFVFQYHVAIFFLASGFFAPSGEKEAFPEFLNRKFCSIMLPYFVFSLLNILINVLTWGCGIRDFAKLLGAMAMGVRGQTVAAALWFLPCLFITSLAWYCLKKLLKRGWLVVAAGFILYILSEAFLPYRPVGAPQMFWGIDSAMCYFVYYALGAELFPYFHKAWFSSMKLWQKLLTVLAACGCGAFTLLVFFKGAAYPLSLFPFPLPKAITVFYSFFTAMAIIFVLYLLARALSGIPAFAQIGQATLILCGTEGILKEVCKALASLLGLELTIGTQFAAFLYAAVLLWISTFFLVPWLRRDVPLLAGSWRFQKRGKP